MHNPNAYLNPTMQDINSAQVTIERLLPTRLGALWRHEADPYGGVIIGERHAVITDALGSEGSVLPVVVRQVMGLSSDPQSPPRFTRYGISRPDIETAGTEVFWPANPDRLDQVQRGTGLPGQVVGAPLRSVELMGKVLRGLDTAMPYDPTEMSVVRTDLGERRLAGMATARYVLMTREAAAHLHYKPHRR